MIAAGGTGGHVFPALAVAEQLLAAGNNVLWVGTAAGIESRVVPAAGIEFRNIKVSGFRGKNLFRRLLAPLQLLAAVVVVLRLVISRRVACVFGTGGYVSAASGIAAILSRKPLFLQEQNAVAGTTSRLLSPFAKRIFTAYPDVLGASARITQTGNPLREQFSQLPAPRERKLGQGTSCTVLVLGGSLGASKLNEVLPAAIAKLGAAPGSFEKLRAIHQSGVREQRQVQQRYASLGIDADVRAFIEDMPQALQSADLVIARAGALTVSEICAVGVAAIFVPYPHAIDDHQSANAHWLQNFGAARVVPQAELDEEKLADMMRALLQDRAALLDMAERSRAQARPQAAREIANSILECGSASHA
ncbi:MAG: undecaprenyldiphospho-muramoylpentapeptide beta-N-acetylglucosaminyltransferase [Gammaproteobacteria bacterium]|nr:undecaprenyldiphospho-muramoylpentapeptide beta-N-acetylglucosaminyltransferase [Gammaproteobacteria bacterium]NND39076.1 undecaprenyldiphospho-muramoylpentapeptide beta-N-acetylglucosaminyltransferase [Pseudomonadales bacterium]NNM11672.1 undecaprenyldiphospho-muramoylpentapeptide beta-N-acetylglucosaminyltransferase [Pseudomonadales bacterium]RZV51572.1 MAG: undecaprenyldiphospho-muramoylpentapeptide beta-N-acetylglucosaminyltransferase [Pseudomonadales bacterium]